MNDKNELNDIILNKGNTTNSNKKIILAVATLGVILIVVVMLMNSLSSNGTDNLPQAVLPPEPQEKVATVQEDPLFEEVEVVEDKTNSDADLAKIAQKLKEESLAEEPTETVIEEAPVVIKQKVIKKPLVVKKNLNLEYYIQVGSFSKYQPNTKFLNKISQLGFNYKYHKIAKLNKVLVGPFKTAKEAKNARRVLRSKVEPGAFLVKL